MSTGTTYIGTDMEGTPCGVSKKIQSNYRLVRRISESETFHGWVLRILRILYARNMRWSSLNPITDVGAPICTQRPMSPYPFDFGTRDG